MVDAEGIPLGEGARDGGIQAVRAGQIGAERFFDNEPRPRAGLRATQAAGPEIFEDDVELGRRGREVEEPVAARAESLIDAVEFASERRVAIRLIEAAAVVENIGGEARPKLVVDRAPGILAHGLAEFLAESLARFVASGKADHGERGRKVSVRSEIVERGDKFAAGQVAGCAEDDHNARVGHRAVDQIDAQRIGGFGHGEGQAALRSNERASATAGADRLRM